MDEHRVTQKQLMDENFPLLEPPKREIESPEEDLCDDDVKRPQIDYKLEPVDDWSIEQDDNIEDDEEINVDQLSSPDVTPRKTVPEMHNNSPVVQTKKRRYVLSEQYPDIPEGCFPKKGKSRLFWCDRCPSSAFSPSFFRKHYQNHGADEKFKCAFCDYSVPLLSSIRKHERVHNPKGERMLIDDDSTMAKSSTNVKEKEEAINVVNSDETPKMSRTGRAIVTPSRFRYVKLAKHKEMQPGGYLRPFNCDQCPFRSRTQLQLDSHHNGHKRTKGATCPYCTFRSDSFGFIRNHIRIHGKGLPPIKGPRRAKKKNGIRTLKTLQQHRCLKCPYMAVRADAIANHKKYHRQDKMLVCDGCLFTAASRPELTAHVRVHFSTESTNHKRWHCSVCGLFFKLPGHLIVHRILLHRTIRKRFTISIPLLKRIRSVSISKTTNQVTSMENISSENPKESKRPVGRPAKPVRFACPHCPFRTGQRKYLLTHMERHRVLWRHRCKQCSFSSKLASSLKRHQRLHTHDSWTERVLKMKPTVKVSNVVPNEPVVSKRHNRGNFGCEKCPYKANFKWDLRDHMQYHEGTRKHKCKYCSYNCDRMNKIDEHQKLHNTEQSYPAANRSHLTAVKEETETVSPPLPPEPAVIVEEEEGIIVRNKLQEAIGREVRRDGIRILLCQLCPYTCKRMCHLHGHYQMHFSHRRFKCSFCSFSVHIKERLEDHLALHKSPKAPNKITKSTVQPSVSKKDKVFNCFECPFHTVTYSTFYAHLKTHQRNSKFKCSHCSFSSGTSTSLRRHEKIHSTTAEVNEKVKKSREYKCEQCDFVANSYCSLWRHKKLHKEEDVHYEENTESSLSNSNDFRCEMCPHCAQSVQLLEMHRKLHVGKRPFQCPHCSFSVSHGDTLDDHLSLHGFGSSQKSPPKSNRLRSSGLIHSTNVGRKRLCCPYCLFRTHSSQLMVRHQAEHLNDLSELNRKRSRGKLVSSTLYHYCPKCSFQSDSAITFGKHFDMHGRRPGTIMCSVCNYSARSSNVVRFHEQNHHAHIPFMAFATNFGQEDKCNETTETDEPTNQNSAPQPDNTRNLSCSLCDVELSDPNEMNNHWKAVHSDEVEQWQKEGFALSLNLIPKSAKK